MTTVRMPVRIRLELGGDRVDPHVLDLVGEATGQATARAAERVRTAEVLTGLAWSAQAPDVSVRFRGDPVPAWAADQLEAGALAAVQDAVTRLRTDAPAPNTVTVTPIDLTTRLRRVASADEVLAALVERFGAGSVPPRLLVLAADTGGVGWMLLVEQGADGQSYGVQVLHRLAEFSLPSDGRDAVTVPGHSGWRADSLRFVARADTEPVFRRELTRLLRAVLRENHPGVSVARIATMAAERAARYPWTGPKALYEFRDGGRTVNWYRGRIGLTESSLPVVTLTEIVPVEPLGGKAYGHDCAPLTTDPTDGAADPDRPFLHEIALAGWDPEEYDRFSGFIDTVVYELGVPKPRFTGSFVLATLAEIGRRCAKLGLLEGSGGRRLALGHYVKAVENLDSLAFAYMRAMRERDRARKLPCPLAANSEQWVAHLHRAYLPLRRRIVAELFITTCQDALLDVLEKSAADIARRLANTDWLPATRLVLTSLLADLPELAELRRKLRQAKEHRDNSVGFGAEPTQPYRFGDVEIVPVPVFPGRQFPGRAPYRRVYRIRDAKGSWRTFDEVERMVKDLRSEAHRTDPFLEKLTAIEDVVLRLRTAQRLDNDGLSGGAAESAAVDREFFAVLEEIRALNRDHTWDVRMDRSIAFGLAAFQPDTSSDVRARLSGVHLVADERMRELFTDSGLYTDGLTALASHEMSAARFHEFLNLFGLTLLAVFFPGVAFVVGVVQAAIGLEAAEDHAELQRSMLGGEEILSRAQVEAELVVAKIQAFLAIAPELPAAVREAMAGARAAVRGELSEATAAVFRDRMRQISARLAEATVERLTTNFLTQLTVGHVLNLALSQVIGSIAEKVAAEYQPTGTVPRAQVAEYVRRTLAAVADRPSPGEAP